jgi:uncharacterized repeat protein (TIGR02543 family)
MKPSRGLLAIALAAVVGIAAIGCSSASFKNGTKKCGAAQDPCPPGYSCYDPTGTCWLKGTAPTDGGLVEHPDGANPDGGTADGRLDAVSDGLPSDADAAGPTDGVVVGPQVIVTIQRNGNGTITGAGVNCTDATCTVMVPAGSDLLLTANPAADSVFNNWSGCTSADGPACTLTSIAGSMQLTATFALKSANVVAVKTGNGTGTVSATWAGGGTLSCGATCSATVPKNTVLTVQATADAGSTATLGLPGCTGSGPCMITTGDSETDLTATFTLSKVALAVAITGNGTIVGTGGLSCAAPSCPLQVNFGDSVTLTATPGIDSDFGGWTGCTTMSGTMCVVSSIKAATNVAATFTLKKIQVTIQASGHGTIATADGTVSCTKPTCTVSVNSGSSLSLVATPGSDSDFNSWSGCTTTTGTTCALTTITSAATVSATFAVKNASFIIAKQGNGSGTVTATWAGGGSLNCGAACSANIPQGTVVTVAGTAAALSTLAFSGASCTGVGPCQVTVPAGGTTVTATFTLVQYVLTVQASGSGTVTATGINCTTFPCMSSVNSGASVALTPMAAAAYTFTGWTGSCSSITGNVCNVSSIGAPTTVTATFTLKQYPLTVAVSGHGTVTGSGYNCTGNCVSNFDSGSTLIVTAMPGGDSTFAGWTGCSSTSGTMCTVSSLSAAKTVTASFALINSSFNITLGGNGAGKIAATWAGGGSLACPPNCSATIPANTVVTLTPTVTTGSLFAWGASTPSGLCSGTGACMVTIGTSGDSVTANFTLIQYIVSVSVAGPVNTGSILSSTAGVTINCGASGSTCAVSVASGTPLTLVASASNSGVLQGWTSCPGTVSPASTCSFTVTGASTSTAAFQSANGQACSNGTTCHTGFCVGSVCCNVACNGNTLDPRCGSCSTGTCALKATQTYCNTIPGFAGPTSASDVLQFCNAQSQCVSPTINCPLTGSSCNLNANTCCYSDINPDAICAPSTSCNGEGAGDLYGGYSCASTATDCPTGYTCCHQIPNANDTGHWASCVQNCNTADPNYGQVLP